jgi:hypothetical protein
MTPEFNQWWNESPVNPSNPYTQNTPAYWAWEGWCAAVKAEREACAKVCYELPWKDMGHIPSNLAFAAAIRARGETK